jgi:excisionase family DNA binding protein
MKASAQRHGSPVAGVSTLASSNLSLRQAAARLGVSPHTLRSWAVYQGRLNYVRLGRRLLFRPQDLAEFEQRGLVAWKDRER